MTIKQLFSRNMTLEHIYKHLEAVSTLKQTFGVPHLPSATLGKTAYTLNIKCFPHSSRSAIGVAESCRRIVIMWIKLHLATLVSWDFSWLRASGRRAKAQLSILTAEPEKTKVFFKKKKKMREKEREGGEKK